MDRSNEEGMDQALKIGQDFIKGIIIEEGEVREPLCYRAIAIPNERYRSFGTSVGSGLTREEAISSSIFEFVERLCGQTISNKCVVSTYRDMSELPNS